MAFPAKRRRLAGGSIAVPRFPEAPFWERFDETENDGWDAYDDQDPLSIFHDLPATKIVSALQSDSDDLTSSKRTHTNAFGSSSLTSELPSWVGQHVAGFLPTIPPATERTLDPSIANPFIDDEHDPLLHPMLQHSPVANLVPREAVVDSFIKVQWRFTNKQTKKSAADKLPLRKLARTRFDNSLRPPETPGVNDLFSRPAAHLPPSFGDVKTVDALDRRLYNFFLGPLCNGRTVVTTDNAYKQQIAPMAAVSDCVKHAMLSLAATYYMDFERDSRTEQRANWHQRRTIELIGDELKHSETYRIEKGDAVVAALYLLSHNEVVNWEIDHSHEAYPKWYRSGKAAECILSSTNPAHKYASPFNIQHTRARSGLGQLFCLDNVMSDCVYPLDLNVKKCSFPWLLNGTDREKRRIVGMTGLSSLLMHYYAKITFLCARLAVKPTSESFFSIACVLDKQLENFRQWSDLSEGFLTSDELLAYCASTLDEAGYVRRPSQVTELIAESYVAAAQIYLHCRFFRRPRHHPVVQSILSRLLKCIAWQPVSGPLFTAQTPMFSVFIAGLVAYKPEDRAVITKWFEPVSGDSRGNVPPAWRGMKYIWEWQDAGTMLHENDPSASQTSIPTDYSDDDTTQLESLSTLAARAPWWEDMVTALSAAEGRINLS